MLETLDHPGVLRADAPTESELGPILFLRAAPKSLRLDQFMQVHGAELAVDHRLNILRQIADTIRYAHSRQIVHRRLSPQSIFVRRMEDGSIVTQICNWQTSGRISGSSTTPVTPWVADPGRGGLLLVDAKPNAKGQGTTVAMNCLSQQGGTKIMNLVDACQRLERGRGLFLFTDVATFKAQPRSIAGKPILQSFG